MRNLQQKAHASHAAYRNSPTQLKSPSEPTTPADSLNSELNILGGRTRLVAPKEKSVSPQLLDRSPTSLNPIVPLPLKQGDWQEESFHPNVVQYLRTFPVSGQPVNMNGYSNGPSMAGPSNIGMHQVHHSGSFDQHHQQPDLSPISTSFSQDMYQQQLGMIPMDGVMSTNFPQYFPVFDYGLAGDPNAVYVSSPANSMDGGDPRSYSPESLQTTWQEFVAQVGGQV